ncbi:hypothetical protein B0H16DRAFT_979620 [Mycena metata]|uniref:Uncharacterized protein n=1 Tax=Mycena metata TaxID=1033252 RepID=A0AAD7IMT9_9AGAR|nr:hypothetical protein B0H16DRAFT_979620 [Mycena metata]
MEGTARTKIEDEFDGLTSLDELSYPSSIDTDFVPWIPHASTSDLLNFGDTSNLSERDRLLNEEIAALRHGNFFVYWALPMLRQGTERQRRAKETTINSYNSWLSFIGRREVIEASWFRRRPSPQLSMDELNHLSWTVRLPYAFVGIVRTATEARAAHTNLFAVVHRSLEMAEFPHAYLEAYLDELARDSWFPEAGEIDRNTWEALATGRDMICREMITSLSSLG